MNLIERQQADAQQVQITLSLTNKPATITLLSTEDGSPVINISDTSYRIHAVPGGSVLVKCFGDDPEGRNVSYYASASDDVKGMTLSSDGIFRWDIEEDILESNGTTLTEYVVNFIIEALDEYERGSSIQVEVKCFLCSRS